MTVLGDEEKIRAASREAGATRGVEVLDHRRAPDFEKTAALYHELRRAKGMMPDEARFAVQDPLYYGNLMVRAGRADGSVAGATNTTAHTVRAALHCIGMRAGLRVVSSFFVMVLPDANFGADGAMIYADCGVVIDPSAPSWPRCHRLRRLLPRGSSKSSRASRCLSSRTKGSARTRW